MVKGSQSNPPLTFRAGGQLGPAAVELTYCYMVDCPRKSTARGLCAKHYRKAWDADQLPVRPKGPPLVRETTWIPKVIAAKLRKLSRTTGRTVSDICREAIATYVGA